MALSLAAMERLLKEAGASRVGEDAKEELRKVLENQARDLGSRAVDLAKHADRKTIRASDISLAEKSQ